MPIPGISDIRIGEDAVTRVLAGTEEIWSSGELPTNDPVSIWYPNAPTGIVSTDEGGVAYTLGQLFNVTTPGVITHLCFVREGLPQVGRKMYLWDVGTFTLLAEANSPENAGWNTCPLSEPVHIDTSPSGFVVAYDKPAGQEAWFTAHSNYSWPVDKGSLVGQTSGRYATSTGTLPTMSYQQSCYFADVIFIPD